MHHNNEAVIVIHVSNVAQPILAASFEWLYSDFATAATCLLSAKN